MQANTAPSSSQEACHNRWPIEHDLQLMRNVGCLNQNKTKPLLNSDSYFKVAWQSAVLWSWTSLRERAGRMRAPHPSYDSSCGSVMCFLTWGWTGWCAGTSRTSPWVHSCLSGASRIINRNLFIWHSRGDHAIMHEAYCLLSLLSEWLAWMLMCAVYCFICFHVFLTLSVLYSEWDLVTPWT